MKGNSTSCLFIVTLIACSCENSEKTIRTEDERKSRLENADWLLGHWESNSSQGNLSETWIKKDENTYVAETYLVVDSDTVFREHSKLEETGKTLHCVITIPDQNNAEPVIFKMTKQKDHVLVFENPKHDFPQLIRYKHKRDSLVVEISGTQEGKFAKERFAMVQVK